MSPTHHSETKDAIIQSGLISQSDIEEMHDEYEQGQINDDPMLLYPVLKAAHDERVAREYKLVCQIADLQKECDELRRRLEETQKLLPSLAWIRRREDGCPACAIWRRYVDRFVIKLATALRGEGE